MSRPWRVPAVATLSCLAVLPTLALPTPTKEAKTPAHRALTLDERVAAILPKPEEERWLQVPWQTNLMQARVDAQRVGKPIFLWIMVGNPQGCT